ncbi:MAG: hypothetical protein A2X97_14840 [Bdellovibrionales bacterium GWA1_52_35]|nr:MAG: hypothetical protein A2X97_14840 [Bdellovibrionales bacterium GWA1_52_35]HCM39838.1 hypothetical protein [Bdellovibrionales bacterium]
MPQIIFLIFSLLFLPQAGAYVLPLAPNLAHEALSESVPTAFAPNEWTVADFAVQWESGNARFSGLGLIVKAELEAASLEWVRVNDLLVVPRARLFVSVEGIDAGRVMNAGFSQAFWKNASGLSEVKLPVALISGEGNPIEIVLKKDGREYRERLFLEFQPRHPGSSPRMFIDPSCSKFGLTENSIFSSTKPGRPGQKNSWAYIGCRLVQTEGLGHRTSSLETFVFWDNVGQEIEIGGIRTPSSASSVWALRLHSEPGKVNLRAGQGQFDHKIALSYRVPQEFHRGAISLGLGPYSYFYRNSSYETSNWTIMPTFYLSYAVTETMRVVAFDATTLNEQFISDLGIYVNSEYIRTLDRRFVLNLMLGVHFIGFKDQQYYFKVGAPQGVEMIYTDFLGAGRNLSLGGFIYPAIQGKSYYNTWLRWGSGQLFGEVNFISWEEKIDEKEFSARSLGVTLGFPIPFLRFL